MFEQASKVDPHKFSNPLGRVTIVASGFTSYAKPLNSELLWETLNLLQNEASQSHSLTCERDDMVQAVPVYVLRGDVPEPEHYLGLLHNCKEVSSFLVEQNLLPSCFGVVHVDDFMKRSTEAILQNPFPSCSAACFLHRCDVVVVVGRRKKNCESTQPQRSVLYRTARRFPRKVNGKLQEKCNYESSDKHINRKVTGPGNISCICAVGRFNDALIMIRC